MRRIGFGTAAIASVLLLAGPAVARNALVYAKPGVTTAEVEMAEATCKQDLKDVQAARIQAQAPYGAAPLAGAIGATIGGAIGQAYWDAQARAAALPICMRVRGYARLELNDAEQAAFGKLKDGQARQAWQDAFLKGDIAERVATALRPAVPPFPPAVDEAFLVSGVRLRPATIAAAKEPVGLDGALATAEATARGSIRIKGPVAFGNVPTKWGGASVTVPDGAVFNQVHMGHPAPSISEDDHTLWCGPATTPKEDRRVCILSGFGGYSITWAKGEPWFSVPDLEAAGGKVTKTPVDFEAIDPTAFSFVLRVTSIFPKGVGLTAYAARDGRETPFWSRTMKYDQSGRIVVPFWTQSLVITQGADAVTAAFEPRTDGRGLADTPFS